MAAAGVVLLGRNETCGSACAPHGCIDTEHLPLWALEGAVRSGADWVGEARGVLEGAWARVFRGSLDEFWVGAGSSC